MSLWHHVCEDLTLVSSVRCHCDFKVWHHEEFIYLISWRRHIFDIINMSCSWCHDGIMFVRTSHLWVQCDVTVTLKYDITMNSFIWTHEDLTYLTSLLWPVRDVMMTSCLWGPHTCEFCVMSLWLLTMTSRWVHLFELMTTSHIWHH